MMKRSSIWLQALLVLLLVFTLIGCDGTLPTPAPDPNCTHVDADGNGICENCRGSVTVVLDLYAVNDLHGKLADGEKHPGVDELTTYLKRAIATDDSAILLSSGDTWQGASESNLTRGLILTDWMNEMGFVSMTLGNHEFDWGEEAIRENAELASFPFLAINIYDKATNQPVDYCQPSILVKQDGLTIGIIGAIGDCYSSISPDKVENVEFKTGSALTALVKAEAQRLRSEGADLIVYSIHDGYGRSVDREPTVITSQNLSSYYDISLSDGYVDLVFEGHSHASYVLKDEHGVYHLQDGGDNRGISHVELVVNPCTDTCVVRTAEFVSTDEYDHLPDDPIVGELLEKYEEQVSIGTRVLGKNDQTRSGSELTLTLSRLYYEFGIKEWGDAYDVVLGGGYFSIRDPGMLAAGDVRYSDLQAVFPFDNQLVLCSILGRDLESRFINNDSYVVTHSTSLTDGIDPNATYYVVVDTYTSLYAPNRLTEIERYDADYFARDLLADYIKEGGYTSAPPADTTPVDFDTIFSVGNALADNATTAQQYVVRGEIVKITNPTYGNMIIKDADGSELTIYGTFDETGDIRFDAMTNPPAVGDTVTFTGPIKKYIQKDGTPLIELINAAMSDITAGSGSTTPPTPPQGDPDLCSHKDENKDGTCESCGDSLIIILDLYALNDLHGKLADGENHPGVDELTTYLKRETGADDTALLLSSGDIWQGASESNLTQGLILTDWMNALDFAAMTLGNHEFDWGVEAILANAALADFPILAINIYDRATNLPADYCEPSVLIEQDGLTIGIIGAIGDCYSSISPDKVSDVYFKTGTELTDLVKAESTRLRQAGADIIIYSLHDGYGRSSSGTGEITESQLASYYDLSLSNGYVDIVFEGHSHASYVMVDSYGVYHLQNGGDNRGIAHVELKVNFLLNTSTVTEAEIVPTYVYEDLADDPIVEELLEKYKDQVSVGNRVLGQNDHDRSGDELRQQIAQLYYEFAEQQWGDEYDIVLGGGYISIRSPGFLPAGEIIYSQVQSLFPFDNQLVLCSIKGSDLDTRFFRNSHSDYFIAYGSYGASVKDAIDSDATYYIVVDTYSSLYADNRLTEIERYDADYFARDLLADYIKEGGYTSSGSGDEPQPPLPIDYDTFYEIGNALPAYGTTEQEVGIRGRITSIVNTTYGNLYLTDENGNTIYVYGVNDESGSIRYDALATKPQVGDTVTLYGVIKKHVDKEGNVIVELFESRLTALSPMSLTTIEQVYTLGDALGDNAETEELYFVRATIREVTKPNYGEMYLQSESGGADLLVYNSYDTTGTIAYKDLGEDAPRAGDTVILCAKIKKYVSKSGQVTIELIKARIVSVEKA